MSYKVEKFNEAYSWETLKADLVGLGIPEETLDTFPDIIRDRLWILRTNSEVMRNLLRTLRRVEPLYALLGLDSTQQLSFKLGSLFSDIGKSGPVTAIPSQQREILLVFRPQAGGDPNNILLMNFLKDQSWNETTLVEHLSAMDLPVDTMTLRQFYNQHMVWTKEILDRAGESLPTTAVRAALTHHQLDGYPPGVEEVELDIVAKLVIVADKYDAFRCRSGFNHAQAIAAVRDVITTRLNGRYKDDQEFKLILETFESKMIDEGYCNGGV